MDIERFDELTHLLAAVPSRRDVLRGLFGAGLSVGFARGLPDAAAARKKGKHKHKKKPKLQRNAFGCVDVGGKCMGHSANCCSGVCEGEKPKKGKRDTSVCVAHDDAGICFPNDSFTVDEDFPCSTSNEFCFCALTTGNAGFCGEFGFAADSPCRNCFKDADCQIEFGPGAACVVLGAPGSAICPDTGRRACIRPCA